MMVKAHVGAVGSGDNDIKMLKRATVAFSIQDAEDEVKEAADIVLLNENLEQGEQGVQDDLKQVALTVRHGREFKDHLMKFIML